MKPKKIITMLAVVGVSAALVKTGGLASLFAKTASVAAFIKIGSFAQGTPTISGTSLTYNGFEQTLGTVTPGNGGGAVTYSSSEGGVYSPTAPTGKDSGTYTVYYKIEGNSGHTGKSGSYTATISKKMPSIVLSPSSGKAESGGTASFTYTYDGDGSISVNSQNPDTASVLHDAAGQSVSITAGSVSSTSYATITVSASEGRNYKASSTDYVLTVSQSSTYNIEYHANGGSGSMASDTFKSTSVMKLSKNTFTPADSTRYYFSRWNTESDGTGKSFTDGETISADDIKTYCSSSTSTPTLHLYAQWKKTQTSGSHTNNFNDEGSADGNDVGSLNTTDVVTIPGALYLHVKAYYDACRSTSPYNNTSGSDVPGSGVSGAYSASNWDDKFFVWEGSHTDYNPNINPYNSSIPSSKIGTSPFYSTQYGKTVYGTAFAANSSGSPTRSSLAGQTDILSKMHVGECDIKGDTVTFGYYAEGENEYKSPSYGYFAEVTPTYPQTVVFDSNGGSGTMANETYDVAVEKALTKNTLLPPSSEYTFNGWNTKADGSGTRISDEARFTPAEIAAMSQVPSSDTLVLYAQWKKYDEPRISHTPNIDDDGNRLEAYDLYLNYNDVVTVPGAKKLHVQFYYSTYSSGEWACIWAGNHPEYLASDSTYYSKSALGNNTGVNKDGRFYGNGKKITKSSISPLKGDIDGDSVTFGFVAYRAKAPSGYSAGYGYYAVVTADFGDAVPVRIVYHPNGGSGTVEEEELSETEVKYLTKNAFEPSNADRYLFTGWNTKADGTGKSFEDEAPVTSVTISDYCDTTQSPAVLDLYAQWETHKTILHSENVDDNGFASAGYPASTNQHGDNASILQKTVTIDGASKLHVKLYYSTGGGDGLDLVYLYKGVYSSDAYYDYRWHLYGTSADSDKIGSYGGGTKSVMSIDDPNIKITELDVPGDSVTFDFVRYYNSTGGYFGFYAEVSPVYDESSAKALTIFGDWD